MSMVLLTASGWVWRISVGLAAISFLAMAAAGVYFLRNRPDFRYRILVALLTLSLVGAGVTRVIVAWIGPAPGQPAYSAVINSVFAIAMALATIRLLPSAMSLASREELAALNQSLRAEMEARSYAEERLRRMMDSQRLAGEAKIGAYFEAAAQAIIVAARDGTIQLVNRRTEEMFGYTRAELIGQSLEILIPARRRALHAVHRAEFFRDPGIRPMGANLDLAAVRKDGTEFPVEIGLSYVETESGVLAMALVSDVTERKRHEAELARKTTALRSNEEQLRSYLEAAAQAFVVASEDGQIVMVNHAAEEMFGHTREDLLGRGLDLILPSIYRDVAPDQHAAYLAGPRRRVLGEIFGRRKNGAEFAAEVGLSTVETPDGMLALALISDVHERKRHSDELAAANAELRRSNTELEQFAYVASHDLQEPLRMITSYLNLLDRRARGKLDEDSEEFLRYAVNGAERMKSLIRDFLQVSRISRQALQLDSTSADSMVQTAFSNLTGSIEESHATIAIGPLPSIPADPVLLAQVFQNLVGNAIKFRGPRRPEIRISAREQGGEWIFSVRDNGIGIESQHAERIFQIFERLHEASEYPGSGIGLAVSKKIVERHGGRIWVESEHGAGSTFHFAIPTKMESQREKAGVN
jgi:PAS domain S-box-containing protein